MMRILLAIDGSVYSDAAAAEVGRRPWPPQSEVRIITVDPPLDSSLLGRGTVTVYDELVRQQRAQALRHLSAATAVVRQNAPDLLVTPVLREGHPKEAILEEAKNWGADLIVMGSHGYGAIRGFFLGSVSLAVVTSAPCSVEVVRLPATASTEATGSDS
jgi:nucleotide-binding universal stress UspA family protein